MFYFRLFGVDWQLSFGFFALVAAFLFVDAGGFALAFLVAAVFHELGHLMVMALLGVHLHRVSLTVRGAVIARDEKTRLSYSGEFFVLAAGAGANLLAALLFYCLSGERAEAFSAVNSALAIYHLLPLEGLDGGSLLELCCVGILGAARGGAVAQLISFCFSIASLVAVAFMTIRYGFSLGGILMVVIFVSAVIPKKR